MHSEENCPLPNGSCLLSITTVDFAVVVGWVRRGPASVGDFSAVREMRLRGMRPLGATFG